MATPTYDELVGTPQSSVPTYDELTGPKTPSYEELTSPAGGGIGDVARSETSVAGQTPKVNLQKAAENFAFFTPAAAVLSATEGLKNQTVGDALRGVRERAEQSLDLVPKPKDAESAGNIAELLDPSGGFSILRKVLGPDKTDTIAKAGVSAGADLANFFTSPLGASTLGIGSLPSGLQKIVSGLFAGQAALNAPESVQRWMEAKTPQEKSDAGVALAENAAMFFGPLIHASGRGAPDVDTAVSRAKSLTAEGADLVSQRRETRTGMEKLTPPAIPATNQDVLQDADTIDGLVRSRQAWQTRFSSAPPEDQPRIQSAIDEIDQQLSHTDPTAYREALARTQAPEPTKLPGEAATTEVTTGGPQPESGRSLLFEQARKESGVVPEEASGKTPEEIVRDHITSNLKPDQEGEVTIGGQRYDAADVKGAKGEVLADVEHDMAKAEERVDKLKDKKTDLQDELASEEGDRMLSIEERDGFAKTLAEDDGTTPQEDMREARNLHREVSQDISVHDRAIAKLKAKIALHDKQISEHQAAYDAHSRQYDALEKVDPTDAPPKEEAQTPEPKISEDGKDWTSATEEGPKGMKRGGDESGAIVVPKIKVADRKLTELDAATTERSGKLQRSTDDARRAQREIKKAIPDETRQGGVSLWIEADGDLSKLSAWEAGAKGKEFKAAAKAAQSLTPEEIAIARKVQASFDALERRGNKYEVLGAHRDNYVPHVWDVDKSKPALTGGGRLQQNFKFAKARTFETFAEGDAAGFKPKTLAIAKLLPAYIHEMNKVIADRQFVEKLSEGTAKDGRPMVVPRGRVSDIETESGGKAYLANPRAMKGLKDTAGNDVDTSDYKTMENQPALHDWRWEGKDTEGNPIFMKDDLALHPDAAKRVRSMLGQSAIREWYNEPGEGVSVIPKAIVRGIDTAQAVMKREMFSLLSPFHQVQEGWHAISHFVNPFFGLEKIDLRKPEQLDATKHGLMLLPDRVSAQSYLEGLGGQGGFISQVTRKFGGAAGRTVADVIDGYQDYLFHKYIPALKFSAYTSMLERNMKRFAPELARGELNDADVKLLSAEQSNAAFGHLNLALSDRNPTIQHLVQMSLLAPDFLEARARFVGQASKALIGAKGGREQLKAIATMAVIQAGLAYATTKLGGGDYDPKHPFEAVIGNRRYTLRSVPEDIASLLSDPRQFTYGRVNPLTTRGGIQLLTGLNYRGEKVGPLDTAEELLAQYIPITVRALPGVRSLTETSKKNPVSPVEQLAGALGLRVSRKSPISDTYKLAHEWMKKQGEPEDTGSYPVSKYQQFRYALEDGDLSRAGEEYDKLLKGSTRAKIAFGFKESVNHPFTKNNAMDAEFRRTLKDKDAAVFDLAKRKRQEILLRFGSIR